MKKALIILLAVMVFLGLSACDVTPVAVDDIPSDSYPDNGRDVAYDVGQLDILNKLRAVKDAGKSDEEPYALGSVIEYKTLSENGSEYILANVLRHTKGQENYAGLGDDYCWIIHELGTQNYTWLRSNAELLDFASPNEISFQFGYSDSFYCSFPYYCSFPSKCTYFYTGSRWVIKGDPVWLNAEKTPVEFGYIAYKDPDEDAQAELAKFPFSLSEVYFSPDRIGLITTGGAGNGPVPYIRIRRGDSIYKLQITLQDCSLALSSVPKPPEYCVITDCTAAQDGKNTVVTITFSGYRYYRAVLDDLGGWYEGMSTEIVLQ